MEFNRFHTDFKSFTYAFKWSGLVYFLIKVIDDKNTIRTVIFRTSF